MPELPDLEVLKKVLNERLPGTAIERAEVLSPLVIRQPLAEEFISILTGNSFGLVERRGKFLLFNLTSGHVLAIHFMLAGRLQLCQKQERRRAKTCFVLSLGEDMQLRLFDSKSMAKVYLVGRRKLNQIPRWTEMGPEAIGDEVSLDVFRDRLMRRSGQIKNILMNDTFLTGIGNAYSDEILFEAGLYPYWLRTTLSEEEIAKLYHAMQTVLTKATHTLIERMGDDISIEYRDFLQIHGKGGKPCPRCGGVISEIIVNRRPTNFCRKCQRA